MRRIVLIFALIASSCVASPGEPPSSALVPSAAMPVGSGSTGGAGVAESSGGGGGGAAGAIGGGLAAGAIDRPPGARTTTAACPIAFAEELEAAIATVESRPAHDALELLRLTIDRSMGASFSARLSAVSRLQNLAQRLERHGDISADAAARIADLAPCYLE